VEVRWLCPIRRIHCLAVKFYRTRSNSNSSSDICGCILFAVIVFVVVCTSVAASSRLTVSSLERFLSDSRTSATDGPSLCRRIEAPATCHHRRCQEGRHACSARVPQDPPRRARSWARSSFLRQTLRQRTRLVQVGNVICLGYYRLQRFQFREFIKYLLCAQIFLEHNDHPSNHSSLEFHALTRKPS